MYFHKAMQQPDKKKFVREIIIEVKGHWDNKNWKLITKEYVPEDETVLDSVKSTRW